MWFTISTVIPFTNDPVAVHDVRTHHGVGTGGALTFTGQLKRSLHVDWLYAHFAYLCSGDDRPFRDGGLLLQNIDPLCIRSFGISGKSWVNTIPFLRQTPWRVSSWKR